MNKVSGMVLFSPSLQSLESASIFVNPIISFSPASKMSVKTQDTLSAHAEVLTYKLYKDHRRNIRSPGVVVVEHFKSSYVSKAYQLFKPGLVDEIDHILFVQNLKQLFAQVVENKRSQHFQRFYTVFLFPFHMPELGRVSNLVCALVYNSELLYTY